MGSGVGPSELRRFVMHTEGTVSPKEVGSLYKRAEMLARMPLPVQRWIVEHAGGDAYMGFVVEPYCLFLAYELDDVAAARALLPPDYELVPTTMFAGGDARHCAILGAFNVHTSVFWGSRIELYLIAEHTRTGMLTWVICDYESNTINYDPGEGFSGATTSHAVVTTSHAGDVIVDVRSKDRPNHLSVTAALPSGSMRALDQRLWIDGNLSVDYGGRLMHAGSDPFGLIFDPGEMSQALQLPLEAVDVEANTFGAGWLAREPFEVACFPYAQHFLTTSYPQPSAIRDQAGLEEAVRAVVSAQE
ncbi:MAG: hypothetical protein MUD13_12605 [Candidatus Nanopelagicales bacterium]|nr:hypothetical protein [Candidatus Nanopelagicales bacterium]